MKKYLAPMIIFSIIGTVISSLLLYQHYFPDSGILFITCKTGLSEPCTTVSQSAYSSIFGIPIAAFGILYFILLTILLLVADYAQDKYYKTFCGIAFILTVIGLAINLVLGILMINIGHLCQLCISTYIINILIFIILIFFIKNNFSVDEIKKSLVSFFIPKDSDGKTVLSLAIMFVCCLTLAVYGGVNLLRVKSEFQKNQTVNKSLSNFYNQKEEKIEFPKSNMVIGKSDAKIKIYIFTDFLCSACRKLYDIEKNIISKYEGKIKLTFYHYPLDKSCNNDMEETIYADSCLASKSMYGAAESGFFQEYFDIHFLNYENYHDSFGIEHINKNLTQTSDQFKIKPDAIKKFDSIIKSGKDIDQILEHIESAKKLKIESTPTIYIAGRKLVGVPTNELLEKIIEELLLVRRE